MKLEIYEPKDEKKKEEPVRLKLVQCGNEVLLDVVDESDEWGITLLAIQSNGIIQLCSGVHDNLGFQLEDGGYIKTEKD